ncbi:glycosyltransferase family 4 protein [Paenibacillus nitricinens]|uniref:glycosyltransferase family 4 protein n=1 Tax=Paenibacillus nitricinens TaxID=3367691 RepID=UPI003F84DBAC
MKLQYICRWNTNKKKAWSGTTHSLFTALNKKVDLEEIDLTYTKFQTFFLTLLNLRIRDRKIKINTPFRKLTTRFRQNKLDAALKNNVNTPKLLIEDFGICENAYYYTDLTIDSILYIRDNSPSVGKFSNFNNVPTVDLLRQNSEQLRILKNGKGIFTMSKWLAEYLVKQGGFPEGNIHYVGGGINLDINLIKSEVKSNKKVLFVGRDFHRKGGDLVVDAINILNVKYDKEVELFVAGYKAKELNEENKNIHYLGDLDSVQLSEYFNKCDIFCMPSRFEAYGLVFVEALVYGLPCIGRNSFEMKEFIQDGENGYLIDDDDAECLAMKMYDLLNNENIKTNVLSKKKEYIYRYSWSSVADRILNVIGEK